MQEFCSDIAFYDPLMIFFVHFRPVLLLIKSFYYLLRLIKLKMISVDESSDDLACCEDGDFDNKDVSKGA